MRITLLRSIGLCLIIAAAFSGCKTRDDADPASSWTLDGVTYVVSGYHSSQSGGYSLMATDAGFLGATTNHVTLKFGDKPVGDGSIPIGNDAGQLSIIVYAQHGTFGKEKSFANYAVTAEKANYTFSNGKITIDIPELLLKSLTGVGRDVKFSAHLVEH